MGVLVPSNPSFTSTTHVDIILPKSLWGSMWPSSTTLLTTLNLSHVLLMVPKSSVEWENTWNNVRGVCDKFVFKGIDHVTIAHFIP